MPNRPSTIAFLVAIVLSQANAQGLVGGDPDAGSNWPHPASPAANPFPRSTAAPAELLQRDRIAQLGKALFWEEQVSSDNTMACGTCHQPSVGGTDGRPGPTNENGTADRWV